MKKITFLTLILICVNCGLCQAKDLKLSMLPRYFPDKLTAMITPLAAYLSKEVGVPVTPILTENFAAYETKIMKGDIAIGYQNPLVYVNVSGRHEVLATAVKGAGGDRFRGVVITRPDSGISRLMALKGKKVMIVSKTSAGGFLSQKLALKENGLDVERDCIVSVAADNRQENVIISVSIGDVDAGFIRESALHKADDYIMPGSVKVVEETAWLPNWALSVNKSMPQQQKDAIQGALLKLESDSTVLKAMNLKSFIAASDSDYDVIRSLIEDI